MRSGFLMVAWTTAVLAGGCGATPEIATPTSPSSRVDPGSSTQPPPTSATCVSSKAEWAVGQTASDDLLARARGAAGAEVARFLRPDQPITMEFLGSRLNLHLNDRSVVQSVTCG